MSTAQVEKAKKTYRTISGLLTSIAVIGATGAGAGAVALWQQDFPWWMIGLAYCVIVFAWGGFFNLIATTLK